jgi:hypothetical protein
MHDMILSKGLIQYKASLRYQVRPRFGIHWVIAVLGILIGILLSYFGLPLEGAGIAILSLAPLLFNYDRQLMPQLFIGPCTFMYIFHALGYAIGPLGQRYIVGYLSVIEEGFVFAQWGGVIGILVFVLVYPRIFRIFFRKKSHPLKNSNLTEGDWYIYGLLMLIVSVFILSFGFETGAGNRLLGMVDVPVTISSIYSAFQIVHQIMFLYLGYAAARHRKTWGIFWISILIAYSAFFFLEGGRGTVVTACLISGIGVVLGGVSRRKVLLVGLISALIFIPISGVVHDYRKYYAERIESISGRMTDFRDATNNFFQERGFRASATSDIFFQRITADSVDRVFLLVPRFIPFAGFEGIERVTYALIPRLVDPDRPNLMDGNELAIRFEASPEGTEGSYMPAVGDGYRRFGWTGVVLLYAFSAIIFGALIGLAWRLRERLEWSAMLIFLTIISAGIWSATLLSNFYTLFWVVPKYLIFFWLLRWVQMHLRGIARQHRYTMSARISSFSPWASPYIKR